MTGAGRSRALRAFLAQAAWWVWLFGVAALSVFDAVMTVESLAHHRSVPAEYWGAVSVAGATCCLILGGELRRSRKRGSGR